MIDIIFGLGNPGPRYARTRHNLGFIAVDLLLARLRAERLSGGPEWVGWAIGDGQVKSYLVKPLSYVNRAGWVAAEIIERFESAVDRFFVIVDDYNLPLGSIRIRRSGSSGGHNGMESIVAEIGSEEFPRMRLGIGPLPPEVDANREFIPDFVLGEFEPDELAIVEDMLNRAVEALLLIVKGELDLAISKYNSTYPTPEN